MTKLPALHVVPLDPELREHVLDLSVQPAQQRFVGRIGDLLADAEHRASCEPMVVLRNGQAIGFYCIETNVRTIAGRDLDLPALGLRGFFIDTRWQGLGLGAAAITALLDDLARRHPQARLLALTVGDDNAPAVALYRRSGFVDGTERYHGGRASGAQSLWLRPLPP